MPNSLEQYREDLRNLVNRSGFQSEGHKIRSFPHDKRKRVEGVVLAEAISFNSGGVLDFHEQVEINDGQVVRYKYTYRYKNGSQEFRYDKDPKAARGLEHPVCHLHVSGHNDTRYMTHETSFEEVFEFIIARFESGR